MVNSGNERDVGDGGDGGDGLEMMEIIEIMEMMLLLRPCGLLVLGSLATASILLILTGRC